MTWARTLAIYNRLLATAEQEAGGYVPSEAKDLLHAAAEVMATDPADSSALEAVA
jgi:hypothetical protein